MVARSVAGGPGERVDQGSSPKNWTSAALTSAGRSCCVQWPQPASMIVPRRSGTNIFKFGMSWPMPGKLDDHIPVARHVERGNIHLQPREGRQSTPNCGRCCDTSSVRRESPSGRIRQRKIDVGFSQPRRQPSASAGPRGSRPLRGTMPGAVSGRRSRRRVSGAGIEQCRDAWRRGSRSNSASATPPPENRAVELSVSVCGIAAVGRTSPRGRKGTLRPDHRGKRSGRRRRRSRRPARPSRGQRSTALPGAERIQHADHVADQMEHRVLLDLPAVRSVCP